MTSPASSESRLDRLMRQRTPRRGVGRRYSSLVKSLRLVLPLAALSLLLLAVVWPQLELRGGLELDGLPNSLDEVNSTEISMVAARVVGVDDEGRPFTLKAEEAQQVDGVLNRVLLRKPEAELLIEDGAKLQLSADKGEYTRENEQIVFRDNVIVIHSRGYRLETSLATVDIKEARAHGDQPVSGTGPNGALSGSGFEILDRGTTVRVLGRSKLILNEAPENPR